MLKLHVNDNTMGKLIPALGGYFIGGDSLVIAADENPALSASLSRVGRGCRAPVFKPIGGTNARQSPGLLALLVVQPNHGADETAR